MKKRIFKLSVILFTFFSVSVSAQNFLGASMFPPVTFQEFATVYSPGTVLSEGSNGINANWDIAAYPVYKNETFKCMLPADAPFGSQFSNAEIVYKTPLSAGDTIFTFLNDSVNGTTLRAVVGSYENYRSTLLHYTVPKVIADHIALDAYNDSITSTYAAAGTWDSLGGTGIVTRHGTLKMKYDAYGTLITNYGTITNAMRVKSTDDYIDSFSISGELTVIHKVVEMYDWYVNMTLGTQAHIEHSNVNGVLSDYGYSNCPFCPLTTVTAPLSPVNNLLIYPQPSDGSFQIHFNTSQPGDYVFEITDVAGRLMYRSKSFIMNGVYDAVINNSSFDTGVYFLSVKGNSFNKSVLLNLSR